LRSNESGRINNRSWRHRSPCFCCRSGSSCCSAFTTAFRLSAAGRFATVVAATALLAREDTVQQTEASHSATSGFATAAWSCVATAFWVGVATVIFAASVANTQADFRNVDLDQGLAAARIGIRFATARRRSIASAFGIDIAPTAWIYFTIIGCFAALSIATTT